MLATFLLIVGHNNRYCLVRDIFGRSHFIASINFNKVLKALNTIAPDMLAKPGSLPSKLKESTRFYSYFKDCIGGIDGTHIPAMITGRDDFGGQGLDPANEVELFNLCHSSLRNVIERIFDIFKSRFTIFKTAPPFPFRTQTELVSACVGLHNFLRNECRFDEFPVEQDNEMDLEPVIEVDPEPVFQTQEQQRTEANEWRDAIALNMWMDAGHNNNNENQ
ncbi:hypothetical protein LWI28_026003 [Acer negundo]|uniref:DDE Tnp4 domain-containing protein n=1 Tax=Acer negundo TaxID=4023 RepID=A0AAD5JUD9_ACENE|nr:hypothetical protein LWI28_026003 [Acer negundo]